MVRRLTRSRLADGVERTEPSRRVVAEAVTRIAQGAAPIAVAADGLAEIPIMERSEEVTAQSVGSTAVVSAMPAVAPSEAEGEIIRTVELAARDPDIISLPRERSVEL